MSFGVVPASSSLRGPTGYFEAGDVHDLPAAAGERVALLQQTRANGTANNSSQALPVSRAAAAPVGALQHTPPSSSRARSPQHNQQQQQHHSSTTNFDSQQAASGRGGAARVLNSKPDFNSLDYELVENTVYRTDTASQTHLDHIFKSGVKWSLCFALGVITAACAFAVNLGVENISGYKFWATLTLLDRGQAFASYLVYVTINCSLVAASVYLTVYHGPAAAGSGIAEVKAYLNGIDVPGIFLWNTLVVKLVGSVGAVAGGLAVGKEGPFVHAGACLGALLTQGGSSSRHFAWFKRFWNDRDRADLVACGTAAGVAAAFRAPVGGVLFAIEEMTSWFRNQLLWYAFFTTAVVSVAVRTLMRMCSAEKTGTCGFFGAGGFPLYEIEEGQDNFVFLELLPVLLLGVIGGLLGSCFNYLNTLITGLRKARLIKCGPKARIWEGVICALLTSTVSFLLPMMVSCAPCPVDGGEDCPRTDNSHSGNFVNFGCPAEHQYNDLATIFFNTQDDAIRNLFSSKTKSEYGVSTLTTFVVMFFLLAVLSYGLALPTGLFVPSILCGAAYGRLVGVFVADMHPGTHTIDEGTYALLGAASFLGGCMRMTVATCVMLLELTNNLALLPLMMLVTLVAKAVGDGTGMKPIYESLIELKHLPYLENHPHSLMRHITASEAAGQPAISFARVENVGHILRVLQTTAHNGFAVIGSGGDGEHHILGIVLRSQLAVLLKSRRCFQPTCFVSEVASRVAFSYQQSDFVRPISEEQPDVDIHLTEQEQAMFIDLGPYVNPSYYVVQEDTSLAKVYTLFRSLGLRHLAVIPRASNVVGVITRHDLLRSSIEASALEQVQRGAGVAGLATVLRGTVREAVDAYQHTHQSSSPHAAAPSHAVAMSVLPPTISRDQGSAAAHAAVSTSLPPSARVSAVSSGASLGAGTRRFSAAAAENASTASNCPAKGTAAMARLGNGRPGSLTPSSTAMRAVEIAADSSSSGISPAAGETGSSIPGRVNGVVLSRGRQASSCSWDDLDGGLDSSAAWTSSVHRQLE